MKNVLEKLKMISLSDILNIFIMFLVVINQKTVEFYSFQSKRVLHFNTFNIIYSYTSNI